MIRFYYITNKHLKQTLKKMGCPDNLKGKEHKFTNEERKRGGRSRSIAKVKAVRLNALRHGKYAKKDPILRLNTCSGCAYQEPCEWYKKGEKCKVQVRQIKEINKLGLNFDVKEISLNFLSSLQRYTYEMVLLKSEVDYLKMEIEQNSNSPDIKVLKKELRYKQDKYANMELEYMGKLCEFKNMTLGNQVVIQNQQQPDLIKTEIETAYKLFGGEGDVNDFLVKE